MYDTAVKLYLSRICEHRQGRKIVYEQEALKFIGI